jgi:hypothetical protein
MMVNIEVMVIWNIMLCCLLDTDILEEPTAVIFSVYGSSLLVPNKPHGIRFQVSVI